MWAGLFISFDDACCQCWLFGCLLDYAVWVSLGCLPIDCFVWCGFDCLDLCGYLMCLLGVFA